MTVPLRPLALLFAALLAGPACSDDDDDGGGDGDADVDADGDSDVDAGPACSLDCSGLDRQLPWDQQAALPTCEDNDAWSQAPEVLNIERDAQDRVVHWEVTLRYQNNHQFVMRYQVGSFCADGTIEELEVDAQSFDPMGTWSCSNLFICL